MKQNLFNKLWLRVGMIVAIMTTALAGTAWGAEEVYKTLSFPDDNSANNGLTSNQYMSTWTATSGNDSWSITNFNNNNWGGGWTYIKCGRKNNASVAAITTSAAIDEAITKVVVTIDAITAAKVNSIKLYTSSDNSNWTEAGSFSKATGAQTVTLSSPAANLYYKAEFDCASGSSNGLVTVSKVEYYYSTGGALPVATPEISGEENFITSTEVSITCATEGAAIQYSTNNGNTWATYTTPFTLAETTTVQAKATKSGMDDSGVASKTFTKVTALSNIAALTANTEAGDYYVTLSNAVVTFTSGNNAYIQDASGAVAVYKKGHGLTAGDVLNGVATVAYQVRNGNPQITDLSGVTPASGTAPEPTTIAASAWNYTFNNVLSQYFQITGATITQSNSKYYVSLGGESVQLYGQGDASNFSLSDLSVTYTIVGFPTLYNTTKELQIFSVPTAETVTREELTMTFTGGTLEFTDASNFVAPTLNITDENDDPVTGLTITYASDNTDVATVNASTGAVTIGSSYGTAVITATFAGNDDYVEASATYTIVYSDPTQGSYTWDLSTNSYDSNPTENLVTWSSNYATMTNAKGTGTAANNYLGGDSNNRSSSRMYSGNILTITPASGYAITSVVFTATSTNYASALQGSEWTNAAATASGSTVTVTPTNGSNAISATIGGTCGFTSVKVYYEEDDTPVAPVITAEDVSIASDATSGEIAYTITNPASGVTLNATTDADWVSGITVTADKVTFTTTANTGAERTATFTLTYTGATNKTVTVTQAAYVAPPTPGTEEWVEVALNELTADDVFVIVGDNFDTYAMSNNNGTGSAPAAVAVTVTGNKITSTVADNIKWNIESTTDGYIFYPDGETETWLYCTNTNNGVRVGTGDAKHFTVDQGYLTTAETTDQRYIGIYNSQDWRCYKLTSEGGIAANIAGQTFKFYKKVEATPADDVEVNIAIGYSTLYYGDRNLVVPADVEAYTYKVTNKLEVSKTYEAGDVIPAGTAVVLKAANGSYTFEATTETGEGDEDNALKGSDEAATTTGGTYYYALSLNSNSDLSSVGFYWIEENGAAFTCGAHKAYLALDNTFADLASGGIKGFVALPDDDDATGISTVETFAEEGAIYNLAGQRLQKMQKGINIVNGKKVLK